MSSKICTTVVMPESVVIIFASICFWIILRLKIVIEKDSVFSSRLIFVFYRFYLQTSMNANKEINAPIMTKNATIPTEVIFATVDQVTGNGHILLGMGGVTHLAQVSSTCHVGLFCFKPQYDKKRLLYIVLTISRQQQGVSNFLWFFFSSEKKTTTIKILKQVVRVFLKNNNNNNSKSNMPLIRGNVFQSVCYLSRYMWQNVNIHTMWISNLLFHSQHKHKWMSPQRQRWLQSWELMGVKIFREVTRYRIRLI